MKPVAFEYRRAQSSEDAVSQLAAGPAGEPVVVKLLAGGQSLGPLLNLRLVRPARVVDIRGCADLRTVAEEDDAIVLGAGVTHADIEDGRAPDLGDGWLAAAARGIAYRAVRNRGTVGGSLAHADPAADWLTVLGALGAEVVARGPAGLRAERLETFVTGPFQTSLGTDEVLVAVRVPRPSPQARLARYKLSIKSGEFAKAMTCVLRDPARGIERAVVGALETTPLVVDDAVRLAPDVAAAEALLAERLPRLAGTALRLHAVGLARAVRQLGDLQGDTA